MSRTKAGSTEIERSLGYAGDGLLDLFLGLVLLDAWATLRAAPGASSGGAIVILFPVLLAAKRAITVPRLPEHAADSPATPVLGRTTFRAVAAGVLAFALPGVAALFLLARRGAGPHPWDLVTLAGLAGVAAAGVRLGAPRFTVYAALAFVSLVLARGVHQELLAYLMPTLAAAMTLWGGVMLARFVASHPRRA